MVYSIGLHFFRTTFFLFTFRRRQLWQNDKKSFRQLLPHQTKILYRFKIGSVSLRDTAHGRLSLRVCRSDSSAVDFVNIQDLFTRSRIRSLLLQIRNEFRGSRLSMWLYVKEKKGIWVVHVFSLQTLLKNNIFRLYNDLKEYPWSTFHILVVNNQFRRAFASHQKRIWSISSKERLRVTFR